MDEEETRKGRRWNEGRREGERERREGGMGKGGVSGQDEKVSLSVASQHLAGEECHSCNDFTVSCWEGDGLPPSGCPTERQHKHTIFCAIMVQEGDEGG